MSVPSGLVSRAIMTRSGSVIGSGRSRMPSTIEYTMVVAAMPSASVRMETAAKPGARFSARAA
jgi:hypothetical protein